MLAIILLFVVHVLSPFHETHAMSRAQAHGPTICCASLGPPPSFETDTQAARRGARGVGAARRGATAATAVGGKPQETIQSPNRLYQEQEN